MGLLEIGKYQDIDMEEEIKSLMKSVSIPGVSVTPPANTTSSVTTEKRKIAGNTVVQISYTVSSDANSTSITVKINWLDEDGSALVNVAIPNYSYSPGTTTHDTKVFMAPDGAVYVSLTLEATSGDTAGTASLKNITVTRPSPLMEDQDGYLLVKSV